MIEVSAQGASKLLEALEKLSAWAGDMPGSGPSGAPSRELVQAFEDALAASPAPGGAAEAAGAGAPGAADMSPAAAGDVLPGPAQELPSLNGPQVPDTPQTAASMPAADADDTVARQHHVSSVTEAGESPQVAAGEKAPPAAQAASRVEAPHQTDMLNELARLLEQTSQPHAVIGPQELFRVQYLVGMLNAQAKAGVQTSQQTTQGMESLLRQSG
ncbi:hypothetical protein [uncultured Desulfovibrio sp.]|uniref:hypothetical protein n=1 Tax=uncultured Desulfovibrio sp. TaxID=167968 RepID=UPI00260F0A7D|nr:hypothetical protein [uncultured Desulfovibrio sp.]